MRLFKTPDRTQISMMPPSIEEWLPETHLARFIVEIIDQLDLKTLYDSYGLKGSTAYDPKMLLCLLFYGYSTGVFSSRKIENASYDSVAFRFIAGNMHPDHDTIAHFRKRFLSEIERCFVKILVIANEMGLIKLGNVYIDGTKVQANASKHKAMTHKRILKLEKQLKKEVKQLLKQAENTDEKEKNSLDIPEELQRREDRLKKLKEAKEIIEERTKERHETELKAHEEKLKLRKKKDEESGRKGGGHRPKSPKDEVNEDE